MTLLGFSPTAHKLEREKLLEVAAAAMLPRLTGKVVLLGQHVAKAFGLGRAPYFAPRRVGAADMMVLPHPSGVNKWWAKPENRKRARRFIAEFREVVDV